MNKYLLDTSALLTLRDDESGADQVEQLLKQSQEGTVQCIGCFMTLMEILYRVWKDQDERYGRLAYEQSLSLPITWIHEDIAMLVKAAELKALNQLSVADSWIAACAVLQDAVLVHKDPEFEVLSFEQIRLPYKYR